MAGLTPLDSLGAPNASATSGRNAFSELSTDQFFKIIFAELNNQDPLAPSDTKALLDQLGTLRSLQSDMDMSTSLESLISRDEFASAASLIGRTISGMSDDGRVVSGAVTSVRRTIDGAVLSLKDGSDVRMSQLREVKDSGGPG
jgi:flagellar basal-body rod modification protein FlgD